MMYTNPVDLNFIPDIEYIVFGSYWSDMYGTYNIYKLTKAQLFVDARNIWHSCRHSSGGYQFEGSVASDAMFDVAKKLLYIVPDEILTSGLKSFYTTGNKNEDRLIIEISVDQVVHQMIIDDYDIETNLLPPKL